MFNKEVGITFSLLVFISLLIAILITPTDNSNIRYTEKTVISKDVDGI